MVIKRILKPNEVPVPSELTETQYFAYRIFITLFFFIWLALVIFLWVKWHTLSAWVAWPLAIIETLLVPDPSDLMLWKQSHGQYQQRFISE